ncbi:N-acetyltransferase [Rossellomorea aquimaris]|uniref:Acetyltransferase (GNAT) family protein n=1 Tax=Rossellomorea aquimaris TaxID=189382 RepID=A0A366EA76_9BACI|nr:GNAT family N-acetyltransferase [Rossellomorea aquimaris]RBO98364.1 acetyltransferase (GNAT) family protein [Rossellomorea aquimaris]
MKHILLIEMTRHEFEQYFTDKIQRYSLVLSQNDYEVNGDFETKATNQLNNLLPNGIQTSGHYFFNINNELENIGCLWIEKDNAKKSAFLYEIYILSEFRNMGYGTITMKKIEEWMREHELLFLKLHVFGSNNEARKLYERIGFEVAGVNMIKQVE